MNIKVIIMSKDDRHEDVAGKSNLDSGNHFDVMPHSSRVVIDGFLGLVLAIAGFTFLFIGWESMGAWSVVFGVLFIIGAAYVIRFPFTMK
jgi:hypothetical protein